MTGSSAHFVSQLHVRRGQHRVGLHGEVPLGQSGKASLWEKYPPCYPHSLWTLCFRPCMKHSSVTGLVVSLFSTWGWRSNGGNSGLKYCTYSFNHSFFLARLLVPVLTTPAASASRYFWDSTQQGRLILYSSLVIPTTQFLPPNFSIYFDFFRKI